ncbi:MAG: ABC transporter ATP-binding protein/permease [Clostridiales bacterium]|jgi:ATP-binding cassette subfamily B protein|nr:ABC transporter ATP-binding protein/permease [Clostridiales bacterium]
MRKIKNLLRLSESGYADLKRGVVACLLCKLCQLLPFGVILQVITLLLEPLLSGGTLNTARLWLWLAVGTAAAALYIAACKNEYHKTYTAAYSEAEKIRVEVAERLRRLPLSFFNKKDLSELTANIMGDCTAIEHTMSHVVPGLIADVVTAAAVCAALAFYNWRMAIALFAALPLSLCFVILPRGVMNKFGERLVRAKLEVAEQTQEYLEGIKVVKAFGLAGAKSKSLKNAMRRMMRESMITEAFCGVLITLAMMVLQAGIGLVTLTGVTLLTNGSLAPVPMLTFLVIGARIYAPLIVIFTLLPELFFMLVSTKRMQALRREQPMDGDENAELTNFTVELKNVSFAYNKKDVVKNVSLTLPQNSVTALVGASGSGKTTVSRLIARFWDPRGGEILIGGRNIREIDPERLMRYMSFVFQDVVLFDDTVMNNIRIGKRDATDEEVYAAARAARCDAFIKAMPSGYETIIGENGATLSGGERQRLSIARALLKDAPIVLLDEATASLDPENETQIQAAISELVKGRTVVVIAHRLRTVMGADKIAVLEDGALAEVGDGEELIRKNGVFARLCRVRQESLGWDAGRAAR